MTYVLSILALLGGAAASLLMLILLMAGMPNSSDAQLSQIKWVMLSVALVSLGGLGGGVAALIGSRPWLAAGIGVAPAVYVVILLIVLLAVQK